MMAKHWKGLNDVNYSCIYAYKGFLQFAPCLTWMKWLSHALISAAAGGWQNSLLAAMSAGTLAVVPSSFVFTSRMREM